MHFCSRLVFIIKLLMAIISVVAPVYSQVKQNTRGCSLMHVMHFLIVCNIVQSTNKLVV